MLAAIRQNLDTYYQALPNKIPEAFLKSAVISFTISAWWTNNVNVGLATAGLAAVVSLISNLAMPFFRKALANPAGQMRWFYFAATQVTCIGITQILATHLTSYRGNLLTNLFFSVTLTGVLSDYKEIDTFESQSLYLFLLQ